MSSKDKFMEKIQSQEFLEKLASLEHEQWSELIQYLIRFAPIYGEASAKSFWKKYNLLSQISYSNLSEEQKESDRKFARKVLDVVAKAFANYKKEEQNIREGLAQTCTKLNFKIEYLEREIANMEEVDALRIRERKQKLQQILDEAKANQFYFPKWMQKKFEELFVEGEDKRN